MELSLVFLSTALAVVHGISFHADGPKYPGVEVLPLGQDGLDQAFESWSRVELKKDDGPYVLHSTDDIAKLKVVKNIDLLIKDNVLFNNITFLNMGEVKWNREPASYSYQFYGDYNDEVVAERYWGQFEVKHQSFVANVSFVRFQDNEPVTCPAVGFIDINPETSDYTQKVNYNTVIIREPFKFIGNRWNSDVDGRPYGYLIYVDPKCTGFNDPERETAKFTSALDKSLGEELPMLTAKHMKEHYEKWVIEPHRHQLIGSPRMNNSQWEPPAERKAVQNFLDDAWLFVRCAVVDRRTQPDWLKRACLRKRWA